MISADAIAPLVRILLRWLGGFLIAKGYAHDSTIFADPDMIQAVCYLGAGLCAVISEGWYMLARRHGWR